jgi:hypothetical protein
MDDYYNSIQHNDLDLPEKQLDLMKKLDRGFNKTSKKVVSKNGKIKRTKHEFYTTSGVGSNIRDAETGEFYHHIVGSLNEDLYFKVSLSTGECTSKNGSNTLFYLSPQHYMNHFNVKLNDSCIESWKNKYENRMKMIRMSKKAL